MSIDMIQNEIDTKVFDEQSPVHRGVKIQARCFNVYNPTIPAREDVRRLNYNRRKEQMTGMGFRTPLNVPYKIIGEPLVMDYKLIAQHGFGPYPNKNKEAISQDYQNKNININFSNAIRRKSTSNQNFVLRNYKKNKQLLTLQSEVNRTKNYLHRVKLGHSFFDLIRKEEEERIKKSNADTKAIQMSIRPMVDSDEELDVESDEELLDEQNRNFYADSAGDSEARSNMATPYNSENNASVLNQYEKKGKNGTISREGTNESVSSVRPQTHPANNTNYTSLMNSYRNQKASFKKLKEEITPYTPIYSSLISKNEEGFILEKNSLTRQLCVLLWLLESINVESVGAIKPLRTCFSVKNFGGDKYSEKNLHYLDEIERKWRKFEKLDDKRDRFKNRRSKPNFITDQSTQEDQQNIEIINDDDIDIKDASKNIEEISALNDSSVIEEDFNKSQNNKPSLADLTLTLMNLSDSEKEKLNGLTNETKDAKKDPVNTINIESKRLNANAQKQSGSLAKKNGKPKTAALNKMSKKKEEIDFSDKIQIMPEHELELIKIGKLEEMEKVFNKSTTTHERRNSKSLKAINGPIHALWTDKVIEYQNRISTQNKYNRLIELKDQFENFIEENSVDVNNRIEEIQKKRMTICSLKFSNINLKERGLHNMLHRMNKKVDEYYKFEDLKNTPEPKYYEWFTDLENLIEKYYNRYDAILGKLLDKLSVYGKLSSKKQNDKVFFKVLKSLRIWELISPDVMSAVEFCRDKILEIQVDEFEKWFKSTHPDYFVSRQNPASAPPALDYEQN